MTGSDVTQIERDRRAAYATKIESETGINDTIVERLIHRFYRRVREDKLLGPVFAARITDWDPHLARMCAFWSSVVLMTGRYHGQPMQVHLSLPIDATHFDRWLELFEEAAREICSPIAAAHFVERAHRIAQSLQLGIAVAKGAIPPRRGIPPWKPLTGSRPPARRSRRSTRRAHPMPDDAARPVRRRLLSDLPSPPSHYIDVCGMQWERSKFPGIEHKVLYSDPASGLSTLLFRLAPGAVVPLHEHTGVEMTYVLEGSLEDEEGTCTAGNFVWRPAGNTHEARAPQGALILGVFMRPNHFAAGQRFFTESGAD